MADDCLEAPKEGLAVAADCLEAPKDCLKLDSGVTEIGADCLELAADGAAARSLQNKLAHVALLYQPGQAFFD